MTDVAQLDIVIRAINAAGPGIRSAQRDIASFEGASTKTGASMEQTTKRVGRNWERIGLGMTNVGRALTNYVGIPTLAVGAATSVLAYKYNKALTRIGALTGASQKQTEQWRQQVLALSKDIGKSPQDLAEGLYFVASSGFKGAQAFSILKASATAAAAGLGNTLDVADAVTSVMSAYGPKVISAAKATDILVAAVREGKAEPQEFSASLGRIIPIAAKAHVSFGQVAGTLAAMTVTGLSTYEAVTALRAGINAIQAPTKQGMDTLKAYGLSYVKLRDDMRNKGLIQTFEEMDKAFKGDPLAWRKAIGNIRAVTGIQSLLSARYEKNIALIKRVQGANGDLAKAMDRVKQSSAWKWDKALSEAKVAAIDFGSEALPVFTSLLGVLTSIMGLVNKLPSGLKKAAIIGGLAAGGSGLLLQGIGGAIRGAQLLGGVLGLGGGAASAAAGGAGTAAVAGGTSIVATAATIIIPVAAAAVLGYALGKTLKSMNDPRNQLGYKGGVNDKRILEHSGSITEWKNPDTYKIPLDLKDAAAWVKVQRLRDFINNPKNWNLPLAASHKTLQEQLGKLYSQASPMPSHRLVSQHQNMLNTIEVTNPFQKIPPIVVPAHINVDTKQGMQQLRAWKKSLTPQQLAVWNLRVSSDQAVQAQKRVDHLRAQIKALGNVKGNPKLDARDASLRAKLKKARADLAALTSQTARPTIDATNNASGTISAVKSQLAGIPRFVQISIQATGKLPTMAAHAAGAVVRRPEIALIGEKGPEAVVPLNDPGRQTAVLREAGILSRGGSATVTQEVHYHNHQHFPQGVVVSDIARFGRQIEPYTTRGMDIADRRRRRGLAGMA